MNQLTSQQAGGALVFKGTVSEPARVTVGGTPATVSVDNRFEGQADVPEGTGQVDIVATDPSGNVRTSTYEVSQVGTPKTFTYDLNGNMTSDGTRTYEWDAENRLVAVKEGATAVASFTYSSSGIRTSKTAGGVTTTYMLDGNSVVEERLSTGGVNVHFLGPGDGALGFRNAAGEIAHYVRDHLTSVREITDTIGSVTLRREYDPWGNMSAGLSANGVGYTGREWDAETGLYYHRARYYRPALARFISQDPARDTDGPNRYRYVHNNPTRSIDPDGLRTIVGCRYLGWPVGLITGKKHCFIGIVDNPDIDCGARTTFSLIPEGRIGIPRKNYGEDLGSWYTGATDIYPVPTCFSWKERHIAKNYRRAGPAKDYWPTGPNSNTYVRDRLESAHCVPPDVADAPGWDWQP